MATRAALRREIGLRTGQPFFRRLSGTSAVTATATGTTTTLLDTTLLKEADNYWRGDFIYLPATDEQREISAFANSSSTLTWLAAIAAGTTSSTAYELWSQFTALEVNAAINHALRAAWPYFFMTAYDETLAVVADGGLLYTLPTTNTIRRLCQVYLQVYTSITGTITTAGTTTQVIDSNASFTSADVGKYVSAYDDSGDGLGEVRLVSARVSGTELTVGTAFSAALAEDSKYRLLDKNCEYPQQLLMQNWTTDKAEFPTKLWLGGHPAGFEGHLLKLVYEYEFPNLTTEAGETTCPEAFLYAMTMAYLYMIKLSQAAATEQPVWAAMQRSAAQTAQQFAEQNRWRHLAATIRRHDTNLTGVPSDYPFR